MGAQSITRAQSIARRHSTFVLIPKDLNFEKNCFERLTMRSLQGDSLKKKRAFSRLKLLNKPFSKMTFIF